MSAGSMHDGDSQILESAGKPTSCGTADSEGTVEQNRGRGGPITTTSLTPSTSHSRPAGVVHTTHLSD